MSSMWRVAVFLPSSLLATAPSSSAQYAAPAASCATATRRLHRASPTRSTTWRRLRQSSGYSFADYARFLIANPDWPDEVEDARAGPKRRCVPGENARLVIAFFAKR